MVSSKLELDIQYCADEFSLKIKTELNAAGVTALVGPSGAGKSSLLRCVAGLERPKQSRIHFRGLSWQSESNFVPPYKRPIAFVSQKPALFSCYNVENNLRFAQHRAVNNSESFSFDEIVSLCGVTELLGRRVEGLSGGESQRVAMARALLRNSDLLLLDEPFSALDETSKTELIELLRSIKRKYALPMIYVSHTASEVAAIADEYIAISKGKLEKQGCISDLLCSEDLGLSEATSVIVPTRVTSIEQSFNMATLSFDGGELFIEHAGLRMDEQRRILIRAHDVSISLSKHEDTSISNIIPAKIIHIRHMAVEEVGVVIELTVGHTKFLAKISHRSLRQLNLQEGMDVWMQVKALAPID